MGSGFTWTEIQKKHFTWHQNNDVTLFINERENSEKPQRTIGKVY